MKKAIHEVAADVLKASGQPMTAQEILAEIKAKGLYEFKTQNPHSVLRSQLRRHSANVEGAHQAKERQFNMSTDGKFSLC